MSAAKACMGEVQTGRRYRCDVAPFGPMSDELETSRLRLRVAGGGQPGFGNFGSNAYLWVPSRRRIDHLGRPSIEDMQERITAELVEFQRSGLWLLAMETKSAQGFIGYCGLTVGAATEAEPEIALSCSGAPRPGVRELGGVCGPRRCPGNGRFPAVGHRARVERRFVDVLTKLGFFASGRRTIDPVHGDTTWMSCNL